MKQFQILKHPVLGHEVVKKGWSWPGFLFGAIWAFCKRLWLAGTILLILNLGCMTLSEDVGGVLALLVAIVVGAKGNDWRIRKLHRRGYSPIGMVAAKTPDGAFAVFFAERVEAAPRLPADVVR